MQKGEADYLYIDGCKVKEYLHVKKLIEQQNRLNRRSTFAEDLVIELDR